MQHRSSAIVAAILLVVAMTAAACSSDTSEDTTTTTPPEADSLEGRSMVLYSGRDERLVQPLVDLFEERTGATVEVRYGNSAELAAQLLEEGANTPADAFYSQEVGAIGVLAKADLLSPLPESVVEVVDERFRPREGTDWVGVTGRSRVMVVNPDVVEEIPRTVEDLTDPAYRGTVGWAPSNAGFQAFITAFRVTRGDDAAAQWLEDMKANGAVAFEGNTDILDAVERGEIGVGLINHYYWARTVPEVGGVENMNSELVFPEGDDPGALVNATAIGITRTGADNPVAVAFVEFLLSEEGQRTFVEQTWEYPVVDGVADPEGIPALEDLEGPPLDLADLDSLEQTQRLLTDAGLLS